MRRNSSLRIACAIAALTFISFVCITCGGSSHNDLSQAQGKQSPRKFSARYALQ
jgi:hypothetical protein